MTTSHAGNEDNDYSHTADQQSSKSKNQWGPLLFLEEEKCFLFFVFLHLSFY